MSLHRRAILLIGIGGATAAMGVIVFLAAHAIATPAAGIGYYAAERDLHETLWAAFGMSVWLGGIASRPLASRLGAGTGHSPPLELTDRRVS